MDEVPTAGMTDPLIVQKVFARFASRLPSESEISEILGRYLPLLRDELERDSGFRLMPHMPGVVEELAANEKYHLGIATGNTREAADAKLDKAGMRGLFDFGGYGSDHITREGLVRAGIDRAEKKLGRKVEPSEVVVIGDTPRDIESAKANGTRSVGVTTGSSYGAAELHASGADLVLDDLQSLPSWLSTQF